jgi:hypothetical protein
MLLPACDRSLDGVHEARVHLHELLARLPLGSLRRPLSSKAAPLELFFARNIQLPRLFILVCDRTHAHDEAACIRRKREDQPGRAWRAGEAHRERAGPVDWE